MAKLGGKAGVRSLDYDATTRPLNDVTVDVCGVKLWNALHSENWRYREAALEAFTTYVSQDVIKKYEHNTEPLFIATCELALVGCRDKLIQVYFLGIKLLEIAMDPKICGGHVP